MSVYWGHEANLNEMIRHYDEMHGCLSKMNPQTDVPKSPKDRLRDTLSTVWQFTFMACFLVLLPYLSWQLATAYQTASLMWVGAFPSVLAVCLAFSEGNRTQRLAARFENPFGYQHDAKAGVAITLLPIISISMILGLWVFYGVGLMLGHG